jgi:2-desacetyl-2-hydroxyethyl bacteriochlorophyllide A dehydrogenase
VKAAILRAPRLFEVAEIPEPPLKPGWAILDVRGAGICGSDMHFYKGELPTPGPDSIRGHEVAGRIVHPGDTKFKKGQAVVVHPLLGCGRCAACLRGEQQLCVALSAIGGDQPGGFAELVAVPEQNLYAFDPVKLTYTEAAFADCVAVCVHAANKVGLQSGESVVVLGDGTIGLLLVQVAKSRGANPIVLAGKHSRNIDLARQFGASHLFAVEQREIADVIRREIGPVDVVFEAVGGHTPPLAPGLKMLRKGGRLATLGFTAETNLPIPWLDAVVGELAILGAMGYGKFEGEDEMQQALDLMQSGQLALDPLVTHSFSLERIGEAFESVLNRSETAAIKVMIVPGRE